MRPANEIRKATKMQVTETLSQGLKRAYKVVLPAKDLAARLDGQLVEMKSKARINGFRPGKVPVSYLKRVYGKSVMADVVQNAVTEANRKIVEDNGLRLANEPKIDFPTDQAEIEKALAAEGDLSYSVNIEVLPKFEIGSFADVELERLVLKVTDPEVDEAMQRLAERNRSYTPREAGEAAQSGDKTTIDFVGKIDDVAFEGGAGTDTDLVLGSNTFIPGFEDQLIGAKAGEERKVNVTFPETYGAANLAGKAAVFDVTVKAVAAPGAVEFNDEFAKGFGLEDLEKLKDAIRGNLQGEYDRMSAEKLKRALLDALDKRYSFELPESLVEQEFGGIWQQVEAEQKRSGKTFADENTTEEAARAEYRGIAERRVRLGLLLAEVGDKAEVKITDDEMSAALVERVRQFPGQEKAIWDYYRNNQEALASVRAPLFEAKVVEHIVSQSKVTDKEVSKEELMKQDDEDVAV
jgi:trigger factor